MKITFQILKKLIFVLSISFFVIIVLSVILMALFSLEFKDLDLQSKITLYLTFMTPAFIILTLTGTLKNTYTWKANLKTTLYTISIVILFITFISPFLMKATFGCWTNELILYRSNLDPEVTINEQIYDVGPLGYGDKRIVMIKPVLIYFNQVHQIDTMNFDKNKWELINIDEDIHNP